MAFHRADPRLRRRSAIGVVLLILGSALVLVPSPVLAAAGDITTYAGTEVPSDLSKNFGQSPRGIAIDGTLLYLSDSTYNVVRRLDTGVTPTVDGVTETVVAGNGARGNATAGSPATSTALDGPSGLAVDSSDRIYIADAGNHRIRRVNADGTISNFAGTGVQGDNGDGGIGFSPTSLRLDGPQAVVVDASGVAYIADTGNNRIMRVDSSLILPFMETLINPASDPFILSGPTALALDSGAASLYIADTNNHRIRKYTIAGVTLTTIAGTGVGGFTGDGGPAAGAQLSAPSGVAVDGSGNVYIGDSGNGRVRKIDASTGLITTVAGGGLAIPGDDGPATSARLSSPAAVGLDGSGNLYVADPGDNRLRKVDDAGVIITLAGNGTPGFRGDGGPSVAAQLAASSAVGFDPVGNLLVADRTNNRVRLISSAGVISTIAGTGAEGYSGDGGPAVSATLFAPAGVAADFSGSIYVADTGNSRVRRIDTAGTITTFAGGGFEGDVDFVGPATEALLAAPSGLAFDVAGNLYIADAGSDSIRKVEPDGTMSKFAGQGDLEGVTLTVASLSRPTGLVVSNTASGPEIFIGDTGKHLVRRAVPREDGGMTIFAGGGAGLGDGGLATSAELSDPMGLAFDPIGNFFIADTGHHRIRKVSGVDGTITTVAGTGTAGYSGDAGAATSGQVSFPEGVVVDCDRNVFIADTGGNRVRQVEGPSLPGPGGFWGDAFGRVYRYGSPEKIASPVPNFSAPVGRGFAILPDRKGGYVLDGFGGLHPFALVTITAGAPAPTTPPAIGDGPYWPGFDIARGLVMFPTATVSTPAGYILDGFGGIHRFGGAPAVREAPYFGFDIARTIVLTTVFGQTAGYILDGYGGVHPFAIGNGPVALRIVGGPYFPGFDIARGLVLRSERKSGYLIDGFGGLHAFGTGTGAGENAPPPAAAGPYFGFNIARGGVLTADNSGGYILDGFGGLHPFSAAGAAPPQVCSTGYRRQDIGRGIVHFG